MRAIFLDSETTGLDPSKHKIIEIAFKIVDIKNGSLLKSYQTIIKQPWDEWEKRDPSSILINGFTWEMLLQGREPSDVGQEIIRIFQEFEIERGKAVFICQNPAFDRGFFAQLVEVYTQEKLNWPYHWLDLASMYWGTLEQASQREGKSFPETLNLSKNEIAKAFKLSPEVEPHRAINGVDHLIFCYCAVLGHPFNFLS